MSAELRIRDAIQDSLNQLRDQHAAALEDLVTTIIQTAVADADAQIAEARAQAEATARQAAAKVLARARADADAAMAAALETARGEAKAALARLSADSRTEIETLRADLERARSEARTAQSAAEDARRDAEKTRTDARLAIEHAVQRAMSEAERAASASLANADQAKSKAVAGAGRLLESIRALDKAQALTDVFDALVEQASHEADRAAVLLVRNDQLQGWKFTGFGTAVPDARKVGLKLKDAGVIAEAVLAREPRHAGPDSGAFAFAPLPAGRTGLVVPIEVGNKVVAVLYADDAVREPARVDRRWAEGVEVLARHAARCLETLTVQHASARPPAAVGQTR